MLRFWLIIPFLFSCSPALKTKVSRTIAQDTSVQRKEAHENAVKEFNNLHFFADGRGMMISPGLIDLYNQAGPLAKSILLEKRFGMNVVNSEVIGLFKTEWNGHNIGVLGCVACHSGKAAGQFIVGLGNKNIDVKQIGDLTLNVSKAWKILNVGRVVLDDDYRGLTEDSIAFAKILSNENFSNLTQGLVPTGVIRTWFYRQKNLPIPEDLPRAAVKVPHLWGYRVKRQVGSFTDGGGNGKLPGWAIAVELVANQRPETIRSYLPKIDHAEELLGSFLPPKYPFKIKLSEAQQGKAVFENTCAKCHGTYQRDESGLQVYEPPKFIPLEKVKTDSDRLSSLNGDFLELVRSNPLKDILVDDYKGEGYFAPRLEGIWARFPYLHNASVPTIMDLLSPAKERPKKFSLADAGEKHRFDSTHMGLKLTLRERTGIDRLRKLRTIYDTSLSGQSNQGHEFYTDLSRKEKLLLIEYLKTL